ncbi:MAG: hypothetical protein LM590_06590 [Thermofilum sp.]|nr:hypothetical protein [Thermofilum sp.]
MIDAFTAKTSHFCTCVLVIRKQPQARVEVLSIENDCPPIVTIRFRGEDGIERSHAFACSNASQVEVIPTLLSGHHGG